MRKLTKADIAEIASGVAARRVATKTPRGELQHRVGTLQTAVYVMCGGGMLGRSAAEQPGNFYIDNFYIDDRVGRLPYKRLEILQAVAVLAAVAKAMGFDPLKMPDMPDFYNCGVF